MTQLEFNEMKERVEKYKELENRIRRLENENLLILEGVIKITTCYQRDIDCTYKYAGFQERLKEKITEFYESEINIAHKKMEEI